MHTSTDFRFRQYICTPAATYSVTCPSPACQNDHIRILSCPLIPAFSLCTCWIIKHRMAPQEWAVGEQRKRLDEFFPTYLEHGATGSYHNCWPLLFIPWFDTWPATPVPLPDLDRVEVVPAPPASPPLVALTAKQATSLKAKIKREADWAKELDRVCAMTSAQRDVWCLGRGIYKKKQVRPICMTF